MSTELDLAARTEARQYLKAGVDDAALRLSRNMALLALDRPAGSAFLRQKADRLTTRTFGYMGLAVAGIVNGVVRSRQDRGDFGLLCGEGEDSRVAVAEDMGDWYGLLGCWQDTLAAHVEPFFSDPSNQDLTEALRGLWAIRRKPLGERNDLEGHFREACSTATKQMTIRALGMDLFLERSGVARQEDRMSSLRRSPGPLVSSAGLSVPQLAAFEFRYGGKIHDSRTKANHLDLRGVRPGIYQLGENGVVGERKPVEELRINHGPYRHVGEVPGITPGPRIGCPILLTPGLIKALWVAYVDSLARTDFP